MEIQVFDTSPEEVRWAEVVASGPVVVHTGPFAREHVLRIIEQALQTENVTPELLVGALSEGHADLNAAISAELVTAREALEAARTSFLEGTRELEQRSAQHEREATANAEAVARIEQLNEELLAARTEEQHAFELRSVWEEVMSLRSTADLADPEAHELATSWLEWLREGDAIEAERAQLDERAEALAQELRESTPEALYDEIRRLHAKADALAFELGDKRSKERGRLKEIQDQERAALESAGFSSYLDFALQSSTHKPLDQAALQEAANERMLREAEIGDAKHSVGERAGQLASKRAALVAQTEVLLGTFPDSVENAVEALWTFRFEPPELAEHRARLAQLLTSLELEVGERPEDAASAWLAEPRTVSVQALLSHVAEASHAAEESGNSMEQLELEIASQRVEVERRRSWVDQAQRTVDDLAGKHRGIEATFDARPYSMWNEEDLRLALQRLRGRPRHSERACVLTQDALDQNPAVFTVACSIVGGSGVIVVGSFHDVPRVAADMETVQVVHLEEPRADEPELAVEPEMLDSEPDVIDELDPVAQAPAEPSLGRAVDSEFPDVSPPGQQTPWAELRERFVPMAPPIPRGAAVDAKPNEPVIVDSRLEPVAALNEEIDAIVPETDDALPEPTAEVATNSGWSTVPYADAGTVGLDPFARDAAPPVVPGAGAQGFCVECGASGKHVRLVEMPRRGRPKVCVNCALKVTGVRSRHKRH